MPKFEFSSSMVKTLKGCPLSVLILMMLARQPVSSQYLERESGYSDKLVHAALMYLEEHGMITRNGRYSWQIAVGVQALPLMSMIEEPEETPEEEDCVGPQETRVCAQTKEPSPQPSPVPGEGENIGNSESEILRLPVSSSSSSINPKEQKNIKQPLLGQSPTMGPGNSPTLPESLRVAENLAECDKAGIMEPKRSVLSKLPHVTARLIQYHVQTAQSVALAIYRIEHNYKVKPGWEDRSEVMELPVSQAEVEPDLPDLPEEVLQQLTGQLRKADFETWIKPLKVVDDQGQEVVLQTGNCFAAEWIQRNAVQLLKTAFGKPIRVVWG